VGTKNISKKIQVEKVKAKRGDILDSEGRLIATSIELNDLYFYTGKLSNKEIIDIEKIIITELSRYKKSKKTIANLKKRMERLLENRGAICFSRDELGTTLYHDIINKVDTKLNIPDIRGKIYVIRHYKRFYPFPKIYGTVTGYIDREGNPKYGIESFLNLSLKGIDGEYIKGSMPIIREGKWGRSNWILEPKNGEDISLTIDSVIQNFSYKYLKKSVNKYRAKAGCAIIMESQTGRIVGFVNYPGFDPNNYSDYPYERFMNKGIASLYEVGSIIKPMIIGYLLNYRDKDGKSIITQRSKFYCENGKYKIKTGQKFRIIEDVEKFKTLNLEKILVHSSNIGMSKIMQVYEEKGDKLELYTYLIAILNLQRGLGIPISGYQKGKILDYRRWVKNYSMISFGMGYEISASLINFLVAFNTIPTYGKLIKPIFLKKDRTEIFDNNIFNKKTIDFLQTALRNVVKEGTAKKINSNDIQFAGKTGTANKYDRKTKKYSEERYLASFVGYFPADDPQYTIGVFIDEPKYKIYGGDVAAPVFKDIAERLFYYKLNRVTFTYKREKDE
jgi:cell division protein FtsI/penicillin-binding protein 2